MQLEFRTPGRQLRIEVELAVGNVWVEAEEHSHGLEDRPCRPGLGHVGLTVGDWEIERLAVQAGEEFRQLGTFEGRGGSQDAVQ
jgi:hypothetical protein